jgi:hypothetical protein
MLVIVSALLQAQANSTEPATTTSAPTTAVDFVATRICIVGARGLPDLDVWPKSPLPDAFASVKADGADVCRTDMVLNDPSPFWQKCCALPPTAAEIEVTVNDQDTFGAEKIGSATVSAAAPFSGALNLTNADHPEWLLDPDLSVVVEIDALPIDAEALAAEAPAAGLRGARTPGGGYAPLVLVAGVGAFAAILVRRRRRDAAPAAAEAPALV